MATTHAPIASAGHKVARFRPSEHAARTAAVLAAVGFLALALFQAALAAGADWGHAAWGGANAELSSAQRIGSAVAVLIWGGGCTRRPRPRRTTLERSGTRTFLPVGDVGRSCGIRPRLARELRLAESI
jgi:hypothetical protein